MTVDVGVSAMCAAVALRRGGRRCQLRSVYMQSTAINLTRWSEQGISLPDWVSQTRYKTL
jgi:hypothetical protein